jgi:hypothetical protein
LLTLITFYEQANYFVVDQLSIEMFGAPIAIGWLFWLFTLGVPLLYIFYGLKQKESMFYRTGFVLMVAGILNCSLLSYSDGRRSSHDHFWNCPYFYKLCIESNTWLLPGKVLRLKTDGHRSQNLVNAEALIIAQVFGKKSNSTT